MRSTIPRLLGMLLAGVLARPAGAAQITYGYLCQITSVAENQNNVVPGLAVDGLFSGYVTFESTGWDHSSGTVFATFGGVELLFTGQYIYGNVSVQTNQYSIRIAGDTGGSITGSTFNAGNFGPELIDSDGSAGYVEPFPIAFALDQFETNVFLISGTVLASGDRVSATGRILSFVRIPEPTAMALAAGAASAGRVQTRRRRRPRRAAAACRT